MTNANDRPGGSGLGAASEATPASIKATYDEWAATGEYDADVEGWGYDIPTRLAAPIVDDRPSDAAVLDAGCGTGLGGVALRSAGVDTLIGGDFSEASLAAARERGVYDRVVPLDLNRRLDFGDAEFAGVLCAGVLSYIADSEPALRELLRVTETDGVVAFSQRTDLWESRSFGAVIDRLVADGVCDASISDPVPYLPGHPDFADTVGVRLVALTRTETAITPRDA